MIRLTPVSYIVLGLVERLGATTPYGLKMAAAGGVGDLWALHHAQLYSEPARLAAAGLLEERREEGGRRRRTYTLTQAGLDALEAWRATPSASFTELRDPGLLQLYFGAEPGPLAAAQLELHDRKLREYEALHATAAGAMTTGQRLALEAGIGHEREWIAFWSRLS